MCDTVVGPKRAPNPIQFKNKPQLEHCIFGKHLYYFQIVLIH